jgi:hypothetical protein
MAGLVQSVSASLSNLSNGGATLTTYTLRFPNKVLSGNAVCAGFQFGFNSGITITCTDDQSNTYTKTVAETNDGNQCIVGFTALNLTNSPQVLTFTFSTGGQQFASAAACEFTGIASSAAVDVHNSHSGTSATVTAGSFTPTTTGDLIWQYSVCDGAIPQTLWSHGTNTNITWQVATADILDGQAQQWGIYNSTSAINCQTIQSPSATFISLAIALKTASAGTAPTGMYIQSAQHNNTTNGTSATVPVESPCSGNLLVAGYVGSNDGGTYYTVSSVTDNSSNSWVECNSPNTKPENGSVCQYWYTSSPTTADNLKVTFHMTGSASASAGSTFMVYDVVGAASSSPYDTNAVTTGTGTTTSNSGPSITPSTTGGIIFAEMGIAQNQVTAVTGPTGALFHSTSMVTEPNPGHSDENNGWSHVINTSTASKTWTWTVSAASDVFAAMAVAFKAPSAGPTFFYEDDSFKVILTAPVEPIISVW